MKKNNLKKAVLTFLCSTVTIMSISQTTLNSVKMEKVTYNNNGIQMVGNLYYPENMDKSKKYPAIVCTHAAGMVKEQASGLYAQKLAQNGFVTLAFDASHQGESGGEPRYLENPSERVEDIKASIDYLTTLPFIDINRIGAFGICAGSGYSINAAMTEKRIKAVAGVSGTDAGAAIREGWLGDANIADQIKILEAVGNERTAVANGSQPVYGNYVPEGTDPNAPVTMNEAYEYYRTPRGGQPNSVNKVLLMSLDKVMAFSAFQNIEILLTQPLLLVVGEKSDAFYLTERAINLAKSEKEMFVIKGATHVDLYDRLQYVDQAVQKLTEFYKAKL
jgi:fermentation-respiration switch protein FrsA (DUF1100 family)